MTNLPIRVFIGSSTRNRVETRVFEYSLRSKCRSPLEITVMNGMTDELEIDQKTTVPANLQAQIRSANQATRFTYYRFAIPQFCNFQGRAIYCDSDQLSLQDIQPLWEMDMGGHAILLCKAYSSDRWATSVMLIDCAKAQFHLDAIANEIALGKYSFHDFCYLTDKFRSIHPISLGPLESCWNSLDYADKKTKIIHFTNLNMQPWRFDFHPYETLWVEYFRAAFRAGNVSLAEIREVVEKGYVRRDLEQLLSSDQQYSVGDNFLRRCKAAISNIKFIGGPGPYLYNLVHRMQKV